MVNDVFIPRGINVPALDRDKLWAFTPVPSFKVGDHVTGGDIFGVRPCTGWRCGAAAQLRPVADAGCAPSVKCSRGLRSLPLCPPTDGA